MFSRLAFNKRPEFFQHPRPASRVVFAGLRLGSKAAVCNLYMRAELRRSQFPAHDRAVLGVRVKVREPRIYQKTGRIDLKHLPTVTNYFDTAVGFWHANIEAPFSSHTKIHREEVKVRAAAPYSLGIANSLEDTIGRGGNVDLADDRVLVRCYECCSHEISETVLKMSCALPLLATMARSARRVLFEPLRFAVQIEERFMLLAMVNERPLFTVVIVVDHCEHHLLHVSGIRCGKVRGIHVSESDDLTVWRD